MIRRAAAIVAVLLILLAVLALHALPVASYVPVVSGVVPAGEFEAIRSAVEVVTPGPQSGRESEDVRPSALPQPRTMPVVVTLKVPAAPTPAPSATAGVGVHGDVAGTVRGVASWFASPIGVSAAGPALRAALGPNWRGTVVTVTANGFSVRTQLGDWCACPRRAIDLDAPVFAALAPLSQGLVEVTISW